MERNKMKKDDRKTKVVSFVSGKGGVGKTALVASVGKLLSIVGYRVLLIDSDFTTHGLTFLLGFNEKAKGILELFSKVIDDDRLPTYAEHDQEQLLRAHRLTLHLSDRLHFIQSTSTPSVKYSEVVFSNSQKLNGILEMTVKFFKKMGYYDYILIDSQAGAVPSTFSDVSQSAKTVIVMEPDPVCTYATKNLVGELGKSLPREYYYVINKMSFRETTAYTYLEEYLNMIDHLPPIPFDFNVRRAFMLRQNPVDENKPSAFVFGIIRMSKSLLPETSDNLSKLEKKLEELAVRPTEEKMRQAAKRLDELAKIEAETEHLISEMESQRTGPKEMLRQVTLVLLPIVTILYGIFALDLFGFETVSFQGITVLTLAIVASVTTAYYYMRYSGQRTDRMGRRLMELKKDNAALHAEREILRSEYDEYRTQLISRREELILKSTENENQ